MAAIPTILVIGPAGEICINESELKAYTGRGYKLKEGETISPAAAATDAVDSSAEDAIAATAAAATANSGDAVAQSAALSNGHESPPSRFVAPAATESVAAVSKDATADDSASE